VLLEAASFTIDCCSQEISRLSQLIEERQTRDTACVASRTQSTDSSARCSSNSSSSLQDSKAFYSRRLHFHSLFQCSSLARAVLSSTMRLLDANSLFRELPYIPHSTSSSSGGDCNHELCSDFQYDTLYEAQQLPALAQVLMDAARGLTIQHDTLFVRSAANFLTLVAPLSRAYDSASALRVQSVIYPSFESSSSSSSPLTFKTNCDTVDIDADTGSDVTVSTIHTHVFNVIVRNCDIISSLGPPPQVLGFRHLPFLIIAQSNLQLYE
jgi:hypothetical protein